MRFTIEIPDELFHSNLLTATGADTASPVHYAGTDAQSAGAASSASGGSALGLTPDHGALSAGSAEDSIGGGAIYGAAIDGGAASH